MWSVAEELWNGEPCVIIFKTKEEAQEYIDETKKRIENKEYDEYAIIDDEPSEVEFGKPISAYWG